MVSGPEQKMAQRGRNTAQNAVDTLLDHVISRLILNHIRLRQVTNRFGPRRHCQNHTSK